VFLNNFQAQKLPSVITTFGKVCANCHTLYIKAEGNKCIGILKTGVKKLFIRDRTGSINEIQPRCVLDFYVSENVQRGGHGKALFERMLQVEKSQPRKLAYDRPSVKLKSFLSKHYNLRNYVKQNNNYIVFEDYFQEEARQPKPQ
jgi:alpha-tubulin N-acetyltransferase 1